MELALNELSISQGPDRFSGAALAVAFAKTMGEAVSKGYRIIRSDLSESEIVLAEEYSLHTWLVTKSGDAMTEQILKPFLYGVLQTPFINEENEEAEEEFVNSHYYFEDAASGFPKTKCYGLASAFITDSISISMPTTDIWKKNKLLLTIEQGETESREEVLNVYSAACFSNADLKSHIEYKQKLDLKESGISPNSKKIHLTSHHGQKELKQLWNKLKQSTFVISGLSVEWGGQTFIRRTDENGIIEIVLHKTNRQYALQVQTTGTNQRETDEIAKLLEKKFDK
jgi:hypothetical protein